MSGTWQLGTLFGIGIKIHFSWIFIFFLVAWSLAEGLLPTLYEDWETNTYWIVGAAGSVLLFASVLVHELSHSLVALSKGYKVTGITLFFLGGVSEIEEEAASAGEEFWIAVVGPATSVVLAAIFWVMFQAGGAAGEQFLALTQYLAFINLGVGVFNMVPAFPLDGGRVLKALVWQTTGSMTRANSVATTTGSMLGFGIIGLGIIYILVFRNLIGGIWFVFIGWFIQSAASSNRQGTVVHTALRGKLVRDAMVEDFPRVSPNTSVQTLLDDYITKEFQRAYVVSLDDSFQGLVTVSDVKEVPEEERPHKYVAEIMTRAPDVVIARPQDGLEDALGQLMSKDLNQLVVVDGGRPVGMINRGNILLVVEISQSFPQR